MIQLSQFESTTTPTVRGYPEFANITAIYAIQSYETNKTENVTEVWYNITVQNVGAYKLTNVTLTDTLPSKMNYTGSSYIDGSEPREWGRKDLRTENDTRQSVTLLIGDLDTSDSKFIIVNAQHDGTEKDPNYYSGNEVYVIGDLPDGRQVNNTAQLAPPPMTQETEPNSGYDWYTPGGTA